MKGVHRSARFKAVLAALLVLLLPLAAYAQQSVRILVNGREIASDVPPQIISGRTMVPIRFIAEALGARVGFDNATKTVTIESSLPEDLARARAQAEEEAAARAAAEARASGLLAGLDAHAAALEGAYAVGDSLADVRDQLAADAGRVHEVLAAGLPAVVGRVTDPDGAALAGALVIYGTQLTMTDAGGWFILDTELLTRAIEGRGGSGDLDFLVLAPGFKVWGDPHVSELLTSLRAGTLPAGTVVLPPARLEEGSDPGRWLEFKVAEGEEPGTTLLRAGFEPAVGAGTTRVLALEPNLGMAFPLAPVGDLVYESLVGLNTVRFAAPNAVAFNVGGAVVALWNSEMDTEITMPDGANDLHFRLDTAVNIDKRAVEVEQAAGGTRTNPCAVIQRNNTGSPELENCDPPFAAGDKVKITFRSTANEFKVLRVIATKDGKPLMELRPTDGSGLKWGPPPKK